MLTSVSWERIAGAVSVRRMDSREGLRKACARIQKQSLWALALMLACQGQILRPGWTA